MKAVFHTNRPTLNQRIRQKHGRNFQTNSNFLQSPSKPGVLKLQMRPERTINEKKCCLPKPGRKQEDIVHVIKNWSKANTIDLQALVLPKERLLSAKPCHNNMFFQASRGPQNQKSSDNTSANCITIDYDDSGH